MVCGRDDSARGFEGSLLGRRFLEEPLPVGLSLDFLTRRQ